VVCVFDGGGCVECLCVCVCECDCVRLCVYVCFCLDWVVSVRLLYFESVCAGLMSV